LHSFIPKINEAIKQKPCPIPAIPVPFPTSPYTSPMPQLESLGEPQPTNFEVLYRFLKYKSVGLS